MIVHETTFMRHLQILKKHFAIVDLSTWLKNVRSGLRVPKRSCVITFDDGWRDNYEYAFPILLKLRVPATIFLVSDLVSTTSSFWPERLARMLWNNGIGLQSRLLDRPEFSWLAALDYDDEEFAVQLSRNQINRVIENCKQLNDQDMINRLDSMEKYLSVVSTEAQRDLLDWSEIREMVKSGLVSLGSHTRHHTRLTENISHDVLVDEIQNSKKIIEANTDSSVNVFCYPNGDFTEAAKRLVEDVYLGACTTKHGWNSINLDPLLLRRIGIHEDISSEPYAFISRLSGWI